MFISLTGLTVWVAPAHAAPSVAIVDFDNATGDARYDAAGAGIAGLIVTRLAASDSVSVVEREALQSVIDEQRLGGSGLVDPATASRAGKLVGARYLVTGEVFSARLPTLSVNLRVVDTETAEVVGAHEVVGQVGAQGEQFFVLIDELAEDLLETLDVQLAEDVRAGWSSIEHRELDAVIAYGRRLTEVSLTHPEALYRDRSKDFLDPPLSYRWAVKNNAGESLYMPEFARILGDDGRVDDYNVRVQEGLDRHRRKNVLAAGLVAGGVVGWLGGAVLPEGGARSTVTTLGLTVAVGGGVVAAGNQVGRMQTLSAVTWPATYYTPDEADEAIASYNLSLH